MLYGDEMRIKQVLTNILSNAIKYTQKGSVTLFVESEQTGADEILLKMAVIDTSTGILYLYLCLLFILLCIIRMQR